MLLGDEHAEEALLAHEIPDVLGDVVLIVPDFPVVEHLAKLFGLVIEEALFFFGERHGRHGAQLLPIGAAGEQLGVEAERACVDGLLLGLGDRRQHALHHAEDRVRHEHAPRGAP